MAKAIKYEDDYYLDSSGIVHKENKLNNILNYNIESIAIPALLATTNVTSEQTLGTTTIPSAGTYLFWANIPVNYYGQNGRDLLLRFKINDVEIWRNVGVCNTYVYTLCAQLFSVQNISANSNIKITIQDTLGKTYACGAFILYYIRLS